MFCLLTTTALAAPAANSLVARERGKSAIVREACGSCHEIPGVPLADGAAGPPLTHFARRTFIAGVLPNTPRALEAWLQDSQAVKPGDVMPDLGLDRRESEDIAAYLYTLR